MNEEPLLYQVALSMVPGIGDVLARNLVSYSGGVKEVFHQTRSKLQKVPGIGERLADYIVSFRDFTRAEEEVAFIRKNNIRTFYYLDAGYPFRLKEFQDAPCLLYFKGNADLNNPKIIGIVGTRKASDYGRQFTKQLVSDLADTGALILSGLAFGIDICAHRAAIENGLPTVGVLGHGLDRIYPDQHRNIAKAMVENGGLLTDFPGGTKPDHQNFPKRNRIVAGLCDVLVVVETAIKGGARITAEIANSYNKDIMALPGRVTDEYSKGCNYLINVNKASLITCANDLLELMRWDSNKEKPVQQHLDLSLEEDEVTILNYIREKTKARIDDIAFDLQIDPGDLSLKLLNLEFQGIIRALPGKAFEIS
jgi:DNA processing protein